MKLTVDRIENNIAVCEYEVNGKILRKEIPLCDIPFDVCEGTVFTMTDDNGTIVYEPDKNTEEETKERVRGKLNKLFGRK